MTASAAVQHHDNQPAPMEEAQGSPKTVQRVSMTKRELEIYVRDGRPTGVLFTSVATLKGMTPQIVSEKSGIALPIVQAVLHGGAQADIKISAVQGVSQALGIDLGELRMADGAVHIFDISASGAKKGAGGFTLHERGVGLLMRGALIVRVNPDKAGAAPKSRFSAYHAAQVGDARAVFVSSTMPLVGRRFDPSMIPSSKWACGDEVKSKLGLQSQELSTQLVIRDLNRVEFDQMFRGEDVVSWDDLRTLARAHNLSRTDIQDIIRAHLAGGPARKRTRADRRAALRLVGASADGA